MLYLCQRTDGSGKCTRITWKICRYVCCLLWKRAKTYRGRWHKKWILSILLTLFLPYVDKFGYRKPQKTVLLLYMVRVQSCLCKTCKWYLSCWLSMFHKKFDKKFNVLCLSRVIKTAEYVLYTELYSTSGCINCVITNS